MDIKQLDRIAKDNLKVGNRLSLKDQVYYIATRGLYSQHITDYELRMIEMKYFKRYSVGRICEILEVTEDGFNKRKKRLIKERLIPLFS